MRTLPQPYTAQQFWTALSRERPYNRIAGGVSRVLVDGQLRLVVQDLVQYVGCVAFGTRNRLATVQSVLIRGPGVVSEPAAVAVVARQRRGVTRFDRYWEALSV